MVPPEMATGDLASARGFGKTVQSLRNPSALACAAACGYVVGMVLPLFPWLDVPLLYLVVLAPLAALAGLGHPRTTRPLVVISGLAFVAVRIVSALTAGNVPRSVQLLAPLLPALLLFLVVSEWISTPRHVALIFASLTGAGVVLATTLIIVSWLSASADPDRWALAVPGAVMVVKNDIAMVAVLSPVALALACLRGDRAIRLVVVGFFAALIAAIGIVQSRTALVTAIVGIASFAVVARRPGLTRPRTVLLVVGAFVGAVLAVDALLGFPLAYKVSHDWQGSGRLALWAVALAMFRDAPVLGQGPGSFALHHRAYLEALPLPGWLGSDGRVVPWAHNLYLELLAEQGALGLLSFGVVCAAGLLMIVQIRRTRDDSTRCLGAGAGAALIALLTAAIFELSFIRAWVTVMLFMLYGLLSAITGPAGGGATWRTR